MNSIWGIALFVSVIGLILSVLVSITTIQLWMLGELSVSTVTTGLSVAIVMGLLFAGLLIISKVLDPGG
jgi:hypothetical protein